MINMQRLFSLYPSKLASRSAHATILSAFIYTTATCALTPHLVVAQELLELPEFRRSPQSNPQEVLQLELLTEEELQHMQTQTIPTPAPPSPALLPEPGETPMIVEPIVPDVLPAAEEPSLIVEQVDSDAATEEIPDVELLPLQPFETELSTQEPETSDLSAYPDVDDLVSLLEEGDPESPKTERVANLLSQNYLRQLRSALGSWQRFSLMHNGNSIDLLLQAIAEFKKRESMPEPEYEPEPDTAITDGSISEPVPEEPIKTLRYPVIYLGTIMYASPERWSVWINGVKYTAYNNEALQGIVVESASLDHVILRWTPVIDIEDFKANSLDIQWQDDSFIIKMKSNQALLAKQLLVQEGRVYNENVHYALNPPEPVANANATINPTTVSTSKKSGHRERRKIRADEEDRINMNRVINLYQQSQETIKENQ